MIGSPSASRPGIAALGHRNIGLHGFIGGAQAGYNYQINNFVLGVEADADYMNLNGSYATPNTTTIPITANRHVLGERIR